MCREAFRKHQRKINTLYASSQPLSPNVTSPLQLWAPNSEMITSRDAKSACFKGPKTSCYVIRHEFLMRCVLLISFKAQLTQTLKCQRGNVYEGPRSMQPPLHPWQGLLQGLAYQNTPWTSELVATPLRLSSVAHDCGYPCRVHVSRYTCRSWFPGFYSVLQV